MGYVSQTWVAVGALVVFVGALVQLWISRHERTGPAWLVIAIGALCIAYGVGRDLDWWFLF